MLGVDQQETKIKRSATSLTHVGSLESSYKWNGAQRTELGSNIIQHALSPIQFPTDSLSQPWPLRFKPLLQCKASNVNSNKAYTFILALCRPHFSFASLSFREHASHAFFFYRNPTISCKNHLFHFYFTFKRNTLSINDYSLRPSTRISYFKSFQSPISLTFALTSTLR